jgi:hypothetical protein
MIPAVTEETFHLWDYVTDETIQYDIDTTQTEHEINTECLSLLENNPTPREQLTIDAEKVTQTERLNFIAELKEIQRLRKERAAKLQ